MSKPRLRNRIHRLIKRIIKILAVVYVLVVIGHLVDDDPAPVPFTDKTTCWCPATDPEPVAPGRLIPGPTPESVWVFGEATRLGDGPLFEATTTSHTASKGS